MTDWFRSWHGAPTDPKWLGIARKAGVAPGIAVAVAWALMDRASQADDRGSIEGYDADGLACFFGCEPEQVDAIVSAMEQKGMIESLRFSNWEKRQPKREDNSAQRVREHRERKAASRNADETQCNAPDTEADTEKKEEASASSAREPGVMIGDFPEAVVKRHRLALVAAFGGGASAPVDIGLFTTWVAAYGWDPEVIAATIMGHLGDAAKRAKGMKYWEKVVREVFEKRASAPTPPPKGPPPKPADPQEISAGRWHELLDMRRITGAWNEARYGPPPGDPGCLVPAEVLSLDAERNRAA